MFKNLLLSNMDIDITHINYKKLLMINFAYIISLIVFVSFAFINLVLKENTLAGILELIFLFPSIYGMWHLRKRHNIDANARFLSYFLFIALVSIAFIFKFKDCVMAWALLYPFVAMSLQGSQRGIRTVIIFNLTIYSGAFYFWNCSDISFIGFFRFINVSIIISILIYFYEKSIEASFIKQAQLRKALDQNIKKAQKLAITDSLTKLYNKRHFETLFEQEYNRAKRAEETFIFAIIDVDNFKLYNDTYGHKAGDKVLSKIGDILNQHTLRSGDYGFRIGGEEFAIILQSKSMENVAQYFNKLKTKVEKEKIVHKNNKPYDIITVSIGIVCITDYKNSSKSKCYKIADKNLYFVKNNGKNAIKISKI